MGEPAGAASGVQFNTQRQFPWSLREGTSGVKGLEVRKEEATDVEHSGRPAAP